MAVPVCECERGIKRSTTCFLQCERKREKRRIPRAHAARTRFFPRLHPQNDPREDSASCFSFALVRIHAASRSFCMDAHSALVILCDREGFVRNSNTYTCFSLTCIHKKTYAKKRRFSHCRKPVLRSAEASTHTNRHRATRM